MSNPEPPARPDPATMLGVIPYLVMGGSTAAALDFYARAFGAEEMGRMVDPNRPGSLMHAQTLINGRAFMMTDHGMDDAPPERNFGHLQLVVGDGDTWWNRAVAAGCTVVMPFETQFWGDRFGVLVDPFGLKRGLLEPAEMV